MRYPTTCTPAEWERLLHQGLTRAGTTNTRWAFQAMTRRFGRAYWVYLRASYAAKGPLPDATWCALNGQVPWVVVAHLRHS